MNELSLISHLIPIRQFDTNRTTVASVSSMIIQNANLLSFRATSQVLIFTIFFLLIKDLHLKKQFKKRTKPTVENCCSPTLRYIHSLLRRSSLDPRHPEGIALVRLRLERVPVCSPFFTCSLPPMYTRLHSLRPRQVTSSDSYTFIRVHFLYSPLSCESTINKLYYAPESAWQRSFDAGDTRGYLHYSLSNSLRFRIPQFLQSFQIFLIYFSYLFFRFVNTMTVSFYNSCVFVYRKALIENFIQLRCL